MHNGQWTIRKLVLGLCIVYCAFWIVACVPKIESADCAAARDVVKRYYSLAIGGDLAHQPDALASINALRSPAFTAGPVIGGSDPFYFSFVPPTSCRVDECAVGSDNRATLDATVIWRQNDQNYLRKDKVTLRKSGDSWLIERIDVGPQPGPNF